MKILITGATGFVGWTLIPYLFSHSLTDICLLVRDRQKAESMFKIYSLSPPAPSGLLPKDHEVQV